MRLRRLDLTRYGKFTDHSIDFGQPSKGEPDLHIIYGLNEAGKSTTFDAFLDLLFGIGATSNYNFIHPYNSMQIGARLEFDGGEHELVRLKRRTGSLVDSSGQPVNEGMLSAALGGIGRDAYRTMFSLDDHSLKEGGQAIIQSKGELGELLFSASSGLAGLNRSLVMAADDAAAIHRKRSSSTKLAELKRALDTLKNERNAIDTFAAAYSVLAATLTQASASYDAANAELVEAKLRQAELNRILATLPLTTELDRLAAEFAGLGELPRPPADWFALLPQLSRDETRLQALAETAERSIRQLSDEIDSMVVDEQALSIATIMETLEIGRARYRAAADDLPKRKIALAEQEGILSRLLFDLDQAGHANPEKLLLPAPSIGAIRDLMEKRSGIDAEIASAERELRRANDTLNRLKEDAAESDIGTELEPDTQSRIESALARLMDTDLLSRLAVEERSYRQVRRDFDDRIALLAPWSGDLNELAAMKAADSRQLDMWRSQATSIDKRVSEHRGKLRDLTSERAETLARVAAFASEGTVDDSAAQALRSARNAAWQSHLTTLDGTTASIFEQAMRQDDAATDTRLARAKDLAELRQLTLTAAAGAAAINRQQELLAEALADHDALADKIGTYLPDAIEAEPDALERLLALESWTGRRNTALSARDDLKKSEYELEALRSELGRHRTELEAALTNASARFDADVPIADLARAATRLLADSRSREEARANHKKAVSGLTRDIAERERDHQQAVLAADAWRDAWTEALSVTWFADKATSVAAVSAILSTLASLPGVLKERQDLAQRVSAMENDQRQFRAELANILEQTEADIHSGDVLATANVLVERYNSALRDQQHRADRRVTLEKLRADQQALDAELAVHNARKAELTGYFGADTLAAVGSYLEAAKERERIEKRMAELREQIAQGLRAKTYEDATRLLSEIDPAEVEHNALNLAARIEDLTERTRVLYADMTRAQDKLDAVGGDDAVARIEAKRRTLLLEIEALAIRYLTLRTGTMAAEQALHLYRDKHRSSMMNRASQAFQTITGGNYSGLATQPDKDKEILIGVSRDGGSKLAESMSTGTQFQLYLALRLAGYEEFAAVRPAVPFVADDIMESFDNPRSEEVFRLLGEMAKVGQVIYLTHHLHLCEIAKSVVPQVKIHQLG
ncbi:AAA family ATPase [Rhizobium sp. NPDC090275]|uniref:AAA family ATPase n=1 Tax=Rhizobium sp. NPDC090275 TaxID=3364498 RepID=UPI00383A6EA7